MNTYEYYQSAEEVPGTSVIHFTTPKGTNKNKETSQRGGGGGREKIGFSDRNPLFWQNRA